MGDIRESSGTSPGHLRDISGTSPGNLRDISGTSPGQLRDSGTSPGQIEKSVGIPPQNDVVSGFFAQIWACNQNFGILCWMLVLLRFSVGAFAPPKNGPNIRPVRPSYSPFPHEFFFGFYPAWNENIILEFKLGISILFCKKWKSRTPCNPFCGVATV